MTVSSSIASPRRLRDGFTPLPTYITPVNVGRFSGRGLSIHHSGKHQRQVPVRKAGQYGGAAHYFRRVCVSAVHADILFFFAVFEIATDGKSP